jgi:hypothetical protein
MGTIDSLNSVFLFKREFYSSTLQDLLLSFKDSKRSVSVFATFFLKIFNTPTHGHSSRIPKVLVSVLASYFYEPVSHP